MQVLIIIEPIEQMVQEQIRSLGSSVMIIVIELRRKAFQEGFGSFGIQAL